jgi:hypothetical protein
MATQAGTPRHRPNGKTPYPIAYVSIGLFSRCRYANTSSFPAASRPLPTFSLSGYSYRMNRSALLASLLGIFVIEVGVLVSMNGDSTMPSSPWRIGFFVLLPLGLAALIWLRFRWAAMVCVIYATVGFAMDLATIVQLPTEELDTVHALITSGISGLFNFLAIVFGGRWLLDVG